MGGVGETGVHGAESSNADWQAAFCLGRARDYSDAAERRNIPTQADDMECYASQADDMECYASHRTACEHCLDGWLQATEQAAAFLARTSMFESLRCVGNMRVPRSSRAPSSYARIGPAPPESSARHWTIGSNWAIFSPGTVNPSRFGQERRGRIFGSGH